MQCIGIIAFLHQFVSYFLRLLTGTAEDDAINLWVEIYDSFQRGIFIFSMYGINYMLDIAGSLIFTSDSNLFRIMEVVFGDTSYLRAHGSWE